MTNKQQQMKHDKWQMNTLQWQVNMENGKWGLTIQTCKMENEKRK